MTDQIREQISALLDGELAQGETSLLVRRMERDSELRRVFASYVIAGEVLRSPGGLVASRGFAAKVSAALEDDPAVQTPVPSRAERVPLRWRRSLAGAAVAAGAALAAVLLVRPEAERNQFAQGDAVAPPVPAAVSVLPVGGASPTLAENQRLAGYLVAHGQYATPIGRRVAWSNALATDPGIARTPPQEVAGQR
jgi:sigma-E factor negative regulatory protein RseA